jgi:hypothetical protein
MSRTALDTDATRTARIQEVRYALNLEGVSPLIMNSNTGLLEPQDKGRDPAAWEREHFRERCYVAPVAEDVSDREQLVIPARAIKKALVQACKFMVRKPKGVSFKSYAPFIESAALVPHDALLDVDLAAVIPFSIVVNLDPSKGNKGPRGPRTRPMIPLPWCATGEVIVFDQILSEDVLQEIAERAGKQVGLLDGRAIDFGRCLITLTRLA